MKARKIRRVAAPSAGCCQGKVSKAMKARKIRRVAAPSAGCPEKKACKRCKPGKYAGWKLLQLVAPKRKALHLGHALEGIGRHQRDTPIVKIQCAISIRSFLIRNQPWCLLAFTTARACAHQRRTGIVSAQAAVAKGRLIVQGIDLHVTGPW